MIKHSRTIAMSSFALALACLPVVANADEGATYRMRIRYDVAELATQAGAEGLYRRIRETARRSCTPDDRSALGASIAAAKCRADLVERAVERIGSPVVASIHEGRGAIRLASR